MYIYIYIYIPCTLQSRLIFPLLRIVSNKDYMKQKTILYALIDIYPPAEINIFRERLDLAHSAICFPFSLSKTQNVVQIQFLQIYKIYFTNMSTNYWINIPHYIIVVKFGATLILYWNSKTIHRRYFIIPRILTYFITHCARICRLTSSGKQLPAILWYTDSMF